MTNKMYNCDLISSLANATSDWPRVPAAAICPRCSALIITVVVVRRSAVTHLTALTLFLLGYVNPAKVISEISLIKIALSITQSFAI